MLQAHAHTLHDWLFGFPSFTHWFSGSDCLITCQFVVPVCRFESINVNVLVYFKKSLQYPNRFPLKRSQPVLPQWPPRAVERSLAFYRMPTSQYTLVFCLMTGVGSSSGVLYVAGLPPYMNNGVSAPSPPTFDSLGLGISTPEDNFKKSVAIHGVFKAESCSSIVWYCISFERVHCDAI